MKITLEQDELTKAITEYVTSLGMNLENKTIEINLKAGRLQNGDSAEVFITRQEDVVVTEEAPVKKVVKKVTKKPSPKSEIVKETPKPSPIDEALADAETGTVDGPDEAEETIETLTKNPFDKKKDEPVDEEEPVRKKLF